MIWRVGLAIVLVWVLGFIWFAGWLPGPAPMERTDAVIVPTGYAGRIERGLEVVQTDSADTLLVTGVDPEVKPGEFAAQFEVPEDLAPYIARKGAVAVDGVSLTVNAVATTRFEANIVPHTQEKTLFARYKIGTAVNIEVDIIARYLERLTASRDSTTGVSLELLQTHGYTRQD